MTIPGPTALFLTWATHDLEEIVAFPSTSRRLARITGSPALEMGVRESVVAVGGMAVVVGTACLRGARSKGASPAYRAVVAGLEAHIATHLMASLCLRAYTAGVLTAVPIMGLGVQAAKRDLAHRGVTLEPGDYRRGAALLIPAALICQGAARLTRFFR